MAKQIDARRASPVHSGILMFLPEYLTRIFCQSQYERFQQLDTFIDLYIYISYIPIIANILFKN